MIYIVVGAGTPAFARQQQFAEGDGYNVDNFWYFLICDWKTSWSLLYKPIEEHERKEIDRIINVSKYLKELNSGTHMGHMIWLN
jgi:hypothetical protein